MADFKDILSENPEQTGGEDFPEHQHEEILGADEKKAEALFERDAREGLNKINNTSQHVKQLNKKLQRQLYLQNKKNRKKNSNDFSWIILAILILLFVCIVGFVLIKMQKQASSVTSSVTIKQKARLLQF